MAKFPASAATGIEIAAAADSDTKVLLLAGRPIGEPIVSYGECARVLLLRHVAAPAASTSNVLHGCRPPLPACRSLRNDIRT